MISKDRIKKVATVMTLSMFMSACGSSNNSYQLKDGRVVDSTSYESMQSYFDIGEHIISIPIEEDPRDGIIQYEYHPGYKPAGIAVTTYGEYIDSFGGAAITYVNIEEVIANVSGKNSEEEAVFTNFGTPLKNANQSNEEGVFNAYEHIISIPIDYSIDKESIQFDYFDGYELVGVCNSAYGIYLCSNSGGCLLYVNSIPVKVEPIVDTKGNISYANIGVPVVEKSLELN